MIQSRAERGSFSLSAIAKPVSDKAKHNCRPLQQDHNRVVHLPSTLTGNLSQKERGLPLPVVPYQFTETFNVLSCGNEHAVVCVTVNLLNDGLAPVRKSSSQCAVADSEA